MLPDGLRINPVNLARGAYDLTYFYADLAVRTGLFAACVGCEYLSESKRVPLAGSVANALEYGACVGLGVKGFKAPKDESNVIYDDASDWPLAV